MAAPHPGTRAGVRPRCPGREADAAFWKGDGAEAFRTRLDGEHAVAVTSAATAIREAARRLRAEAADQERNSGA